MEWHAEGTSSRTGTGTFLFIYGSPQIEGDEPPTLPTKTKLSIRGPQGDVSVAHISEASNGAAILELESGERFRISRQRTGEPSSGVTFASMYGEDWIVREAV